MTSAMLLEYEDKDNKVGEDKVGKRSKWRFKNKVTSKNLTISWPFHVSKSHARDWSPLLPPYLCRYDTIVQVDKGIRAMACLHTLNDISGVFLKRCLQ
jgi:hypothetical protein